MARSILTILLAASMGFTCACAANTASEPPVDSYMESANAAMQYEKTGSDGSQSGSALNQKTLSSEPETSYEPEEPMIIRPAPAIGEYKDIPVFHSIKCRIVDANNLQDLEENSILIVKGVILDGGMEYLYSDRWGGVSSGLTVRSFKINETIKGDVQKGETIKIVEPYYTDQTSDNVTFLSNDASYSPSEPEREYLFFLTATSKPDNSMYRSVFIEQGRYPTINVNTDSFAISTLTPQDVNLSEYELSEMYQWEKYLALYGEVIEKYM